MVGFAPTPLAQLIDALPAAKTGAPRIERRRIAPEAIVALRPLGFGDSDLSEREMLEEPRDDWRAPRFEAAPVTCFIIRDAMVHSSAGLVSVDNFLLKETLSHAHGETCGFGYTEDGNVALFSHGIMRTAERQMHLLGGGNYYHWMLDLLGRAIVYQELPEAQGAVHLFPPLQADYERRSLDLLTRRQAWRVGHLANFRTLLVDELIFVPSITGLGFRPHPRLLRLGREMRRSALSRLRRPSRRLYIDRRSSEHRRLSNEAELIQPLLDRGFEILALESMTLQEQIAAFAEASIVVGAHGAGLTNVLFSLPGVTVIELMMDSYVNWCFRNLAALKQAKYGCVIGKTDGEWNQVWPHDSSWTIPVPRVLAAVDAALSARAH